MTLVFGAIADDLTGGMELAAMLVGQGVRCGFVTEVSAIDDVADAEAIVVALKIRLAPVDDAQAKAKAAARALLDLGARQIFYKYCATFDSTDRGNIGPVADCLASLCSAQHVLFCPSFPDVGCVGFAGHQFRGTTLISETEKRFDPATPMTDPDLRRVLGRQTQEAVGLVPLQTVLEGTAAVRRHIEQEDAAGRRYLIADAVRNADLGVLAQVAVEDR
ncbi:MAG: four-carbon acid sugar kinase family protein [Gemmobacter sp.]|nr:four-carbon acid sugar kinase family protein [Gemmobacter sp.]